MSAFCRRYVNREEWQEKRCLFSQEATVSVQTTDEGAQVAHRMTKRIAETQTTHAKICEIEDPEP